MFKNFFFVILLALFCALSLSCDQAGSRSGMPKNDANGKPPFTKDAKPAVDTEVAVIEMENAVYGRVVIELYPNIAPKMVERFKQLIKEGAYDGTAFHRINETVVQGGDPLSKTNDPKVGMGKSGKPNIPAEFSDIPYETGIVGAARLGNDINSQDCQFFIMIRREAQFDKNYTVFGKVIDGMSNVRIVAGVKPKEGDRPLEPVRIKTVTLQPHP